MANILIIDDSPTDVKIFSGALERAGHKVTSVATAEAGIDAAHKTKPDLVLMDVIMPGMNGFQATRTLTRDSTIAILCASSADGLPRAASNRAAVLIDGQRCPVLGRLTLDQTIVDVTDLASVACGDEAVLFGRQGSAEITITEFSRWADTIPWETLCSVSKRVSRLYKTALGI